MTNNSVAVPTPQTICQKLTNESRLFKNINDEGDRIFFTFLILFNHSCEEYVYNGTSNGGCKWDYTGQGFDYQILAGPIFILIYTFAAIPVGIAADLYNRKVHSGLTYRH